MYLIDSIVKEFPEDYVPIFSSNLVYLFSETFKVYVSYLLILIPIYFFFYRQAESRTKLYDLRNTWDDVFAPSLLYTLDITVRNILSTEHFYSCLGEKIGQELASASPTNQKRHN